jgi:UDP-2,3-diacylglucosamine hydrolase
MGPVFLVSDIHAGIRGDADDAPRLEDFRRVLERARAEGSELLILGDLFDFWFQWGQVIPSRHLPWLEALGQATRGGLAVSLFPGNHDFCLGGLLQSQVGLRLPGDGQRRDLLGARALLHHGDGLDPGETGYLLMRRVFRSRWAQRAFRWLHPDLGMLLADWMGAGDRLRTWSRDELCAYLRRALPDTLEEGDELLVMGHVHVAGRFTWRGARVFSLPPFVHASRGYATWDGRELTFRYLRPELAAAPIAEALA